LDLSFVRSLGSPSVDVAVASVPPDPVVQSAAARGDNCGMLRESWVMAGTQTWVKACNWVPVEGDTSPGPPCSESFASGSTLPATVPPAAVPGVTPGSGIACRPRCTGCGSFAVEGSQLLCNDCESSLGASHDSLVFQRCGMCQGAGELSGGLCA
jgi:hypothetical protein